MTARRRYSCPVLTHDQLVEIGLADSPERLLAALLATAHALDFGLVSAAITRRSPLTEGAMVRWVGNTPAAFVEASVSEGNARRDPVTTRLMQRPAPFTYDQALYVEAGAGDLWELQAPFGYRTGVASALHAGSHGESFVMGFDRSDALPHDRARRMRLLADVQLVLVHAQVAAQRVLLPAPAAHSAPEATLTTKERDGLQWAADGMAVWSVSDRLNLTVHETKGLLHRAATKLGENSVTSAQLRVIKGGV